MNVVLMITLMGVWIMETKEQICMHRLYEFFINAGYTRDNLKESLDMAFTIKKRYTFGGLWDFVASYLEGNC